MGWPTCGGLVHVRTTSGATACRLRTLSAGPASGAVTTPGRAHAREAGDLAAQSPCRRISRLDARTQRRARQHSDGGPDHSSRPPPALGGTSVSCRQRIAEARSEDSAQPRRRAPRPAVRRGVEGQSASCRATTGRSASRPARRAPPAPRRRPRQAGTGRVRTSTSVLHQLAWRTMRGRPSRGAAHARASFDDTSVLPSTDGRHEACGSFVSGAAGADRGDCPP